MSQIKKIIEQCEENSSLSLLTLTAQIILLDDSGRCAINYLPKVVTWKDNGRKSKLRRLCHKSKARP